MGHLLHGWKNMANTSSEFLKKLEKIRVQFLFDHAFLSVLALSLPVEYRKNEHEAFETNGVCIYVDVSLCEHIIDEELKYIYAHTLLHILLKHPFRMKERDHGTWNRSSDIVINLLLSDFERIGQRPEHEVMLEKFRDKSVEEVYNILYEENDNGEGTPDEQNPQEEKLDLIENEGDNSAAMEEIDTLIVQAMGAASKQGNIPSSFLEVIKEIIRPKIDLETLLHTYMSESFFDKEVNFSHPNRRFIHQGIYLPGYKREKNRLTLYIALDRSMSISRETFSKFLGIIDSVLRMSSDFLVYVVPFDESVDSNKIVSYDAQQSRPTLSFEKGNGGTLFEPVVEYLRKNSELDATLMVLSDGLFKIEKAPEINTLFLVSEKKNIKKLEAFGDVFYFDL
jgi:predicted metal-dependent peptidase